VEKNQKTFDLFWVGSHEAAPLAKTFFYPSRTGSESDLIRGGGS
jgi:hypothetical protein